MLTKIDIKTINGAKYIIETLKKLSVKKVFGYPGGGVLSLYDELYKQSDIEHILVRHEQFAVHAAEGYARISGECGVVFVTSGPGLTNTITGIVNAYTDGYPLIILAGQVSKNNLGTGAFQEIDVCKMVNNFTKATLRIEDANDIQSVLVKAFSIATEGKKGPVVIEMVKDIFTQDVEIDNNFVQPRNVDNTDYTYSNLCRILAKLKQSTSPVIISGGGVHHSNAYNELETFAQKLNIPVVVSMMGVGSYPQDESNYKGMIGCFGDDEANQFVKKSDLILSFGCRFNDRIMSVFEGNDLFSKLISIDIDENIISKLNPNDYVIGDIKTVLKVLMQLLNNSVYGQFYYEKISENTKVKSNKKCSNILHSFEVLRSLDNYTQNMDIVFTSDVGQHMITAVRNLTINKNRRILLSGGTGTMGFGLPAAIGAAIAAPDKTIICITGDGSFQMSLPELAICKDLGLNIKVVVLNNGYLGMVRQLQEDKCDGRYSQTKISSPDFVKIADSYGLGGEKINSLSEIKEVLEKAFSSCETFILDCAIESMEVI